MKSVFLSILFLSLNFISHSQVKFFINGCDEYIMTWAYSDPFSVPDWGTSDLLSVPPVIGDMVLVEGIDPIQHGNCTMDMACNGGITNAGALNGKIAVIRRGSCAFGSKALAAQQAGAIACIIINYNAEPIEIAGGVDGPNVTIPTIMVGSITGEAICDAINSGTAVGFIGNIDGFYSNNLYLSQFETYRANRALDVAGVYDAMNSTGKNHEVQPGVLIHNYGTSNQTNISVSCDILQNGVAVYNQTITIPSLNASDEFWVEFPPFINTTEINQHYTITYSVSSALTDSSPCDNQKTIPFSILPNKFSYAAIDPITNMPHSDGGFQLSNITDSVKICNHFVDSNANYLGVKSLSFQAFTYDPYNLTDLLGHTVDIEAYEWEAVNNIYDMTNPQFNSDMSQNIFTRLGTQTFFYQSDYQDSLITVNFPTTIPLTSNKHYLFCTSAQMYGDPSFYEHFYFRLDYSQDYSFNTGANSNVPTINNGSPVTVVIQDGNFYSEGLGLDKPSSMVVNFSTCINTYIDSISSCTPFTWIDGNTYSSSTNTPFVSYTDVNGCDSIIKLNLTILSNGSVDSVSTCQNSYTWIDGNTYTTNNSTASYTYVNMNGCDSVVTLNLTFDEISSTDTIVSCDPITWIDGNTYSASNYSASYTYTNGAVNGCDSVVYLHFTLDVVNPGLAYYNASLQAFPPSGYTYQWIDCGNGNTPIVGETNATFTPTINGNYAVIVANSNCSDTSSCLLVDDIGINEINNFTFSLYPNPVTNKLFISLNKVLDFEVRVIDIQGRIVYSNKLQSNQVIIDVALLNQGVYFVEVKADKGVKTEKIVVYK